MNEPIEISNWQLVHKANGAPVHMHEEITSFRGEKHWVLGGTPPKHSASTGRVEVADYSGPCGEFYPACFDLEWQQKG